MLGDMVAQSMHICSTFFRREVVKSSVIGKQLSEELYRGFLHSRMAAVGFYPK